MWAIRADRGSLVVRVGMNRCRMGYDWVDVPYVFESFSRDCVDYRMLLDSTGGSICTRRRVLIDWLLNLNKNDS